MKETSQTVVLRKLEASEGMIITDKKSETMRATVVYLGVGDSPDNYKEIDENTPLPEPDEPEEPEEGAENVD